MPLGGMRTVTTGARRPSSFVVYFKTVKTATAAQTSAMMASRTTTRHTELSTGVCTRKHAVKDVVDIELRKLSQHMR